MGSKNKKHLICYLTRGILLLSQLILLDSCSCKDDSDTTLRPPEADTQYLVTYITQSSAIVSSGVITWGLYTNVSFEYGTTLSYGDSMPCPEFSGNHPSPPALLVDNTLTRLAPGSTYHFRLIASNKYGTDYGDDSFFTTLNKGQNGINFNTELNYGTLSDIDGNIYKTIQVGSQIWMAENLKTIRFNDASSITNVTSAYNWTRMTTPAYCWYSNDSASYKPSNGALYNWYAVNTNKLCPNGWHIPTKEEWTALFDNLGGKDLAAGKIQEKGTNHWQSQGSDVSNSSGFTALPCGYRNDGLTDGVFGELGRGASWYSSTFDTSFSKSFAVSLFISVYSGPRLGIDYVNYSTQGKSIRCIKDKV